MKDWIVKLLRVRQDVMRYERMPLTAEESLLGELNQDWSDLADNTGWEAAYRRRRGGGTTDRPDSTDPHH